MARKIANIYRRDDGTYQLRFTVDGRRYAVYGKTVDECRQKEAQKRQVIEEGAYQRQKDVTLRKYAAWWLSGKQGTVKASTVAMYTSWISTITEDPIGDVRLRDLRPQHIRDFIGRLSLQPSSINLGITVIRSILKTAVAEDLIQKSPADGIKTLRAPKRAPEEDTHRALTREETAAFLRAAEARGDAFRDLYTLMLHTGLRIGEAVVLVDGDLSGNRLQVCRTLTRSGGNYVIGDSPKSDSGNRIIPLDADALQAVQRAQELRSAMDWNTDRIFSNSAGSVIIPHQANREIKKTCELAGIEPITSHALRDTFATRCAESNMQPRVLMEIMGHASIAVTMEIYVHALDDVKAQAISAVTF